MVLISFVKAWREEGKTEAGTGTVTREKAANLAGIEQAGMKRYAGWIDVQGGMAS
ncbi:MAG: hypothetical protein HYV27_21985 [Candidatus Hydrogenedentes bacterium]|nr:hypothetical protein [Candidatus Hydrogenedentota bacterium]